jgi:hypothetical protein
MKTGYKMQSRFIGRAFKAGPFILGQRLQVAESQMVCRSRFVYDRSGEVFRGMRFIAYRDQDRETSTVFVPYFFYPFFN